MEKKSVKFIIGSFRNGILTCLMKDDRIFQMNFEGSSASQVGNIYIGKVQHIVKNINAAFIDIGEELPAFYSLENNKCHLFTDHKKHGALKEGDEIIVKIKKDAVKTKSPVCSAKFGEAQSKDFLEKSAFRKAPCCLKKAEPFWLQAVSRVSADEISEVVTDRKEVFSALSGRRIPCRLYEDPLLPLSKLYSFETAVSDATSKNVWLKSGGYLVIEPTEAMTVIDVNTGKTDVRSDKENTIRRTDTEAAEEIARQLRLRNISGIIMVDFIDLKEKEERDSLIKLLQGYLDEDPVETKALDITKLYIVEIVREKTGRPFTDQIRMR
jgi:ribonuclease G